MARNLFLASSVVSCLSLLGCSSSGDDDRSAASAADDAGRDAAPPAATDAGADAAVDAATLGPPTIDPTVDAEFEQICADNGPNVLGGVLALIGADGQRRYATCGFADRAHSRDVLPTDRFRVGSVTKMFTSVLTLMLVDEDAVSLDDTVASFGVSSDAAATIRVRHLLSHTSGLEDYNTHPNFDWSRDWTIPEVITWTTENAEPRFPAGTGVLYSGTAYQILSEIIGASGRPGFATQLRTRVFSPLGLADTFLEGAEPIPRGRIEGSVNASGTEPGPPAFTNNWASADGSMVSNAADLLTFMQRIFVDGRLISATSRAGMTTQATLEDGTPVEAFAGLPYGQGVFIDSGADGPIYSHGGSDFGFRAYAGIQPATGQAVVVLLNNESMDPRTIAAWAWARLAAE